MVEEFGTVIGLIAGPAVGASGLQFRVSTSFPSSPEEA